jgi:hypothetical protein
MGEKILPAVATAAVLASALWAQTAADIIAKNVQVRGGMDKLKSVQTVKAAATIATGPGRKRRD